MKFKRTLFFILAFLPMAATIVAMFLLPNSMPMHYDSKFMLLLTPIFSILYAVVSSRLWKFDKDIKRVDTSERAKGIVNFCIIILFNVITLWSLLSALIDAQRFR